MIYTFGLTTVRNTGATVSCDEAYRDGILTKQLSFMTNRKKIKDKRIYTNLAALLRIKGEATDACKVIKRDLI